MDIQTLFPIIDTLIMGRKKYDWVMKNVDEFPHKNKNSYIITHKENNL